VTGRKRGLREADGRDAAAGASTVRRPRTLDLACLGGGGGSVGMHPWGTACGELMESVLLRSSPGSAENVTVENQPGCLAGIGANKGLHPPGSGKWG